ncbi:DNA (cytosine-5-)-methyltransferase [Fusarium mundagurra]|uniref:DNA (cytosine-5-)-methyltransferase n=1 Tax=Fusarium mundagurra TaxID=1567541 RepID=A0A8H5Z9G1_9HYPO|nr:DNA (cytosine-5-)-methyltransferase [Fusarium mundagurra]
MIWLSSGPPSLSMPVSVNIATPEADDALSELIYSAALHICDQSDVKLYGIASLIAFISSRLLGTELDIEAATFFGLRQISSILAHCNPSFIPTSISDFLRSQSRIRIKPFHRRLLLPSSNGYLRTNNCRPRPFGLYPPPSSGSAISSCTDSERRETLPPRLPPGLGGQGAEGQIVLQMSYWCYTGVAAITRPLYRTVDCPWVLQKSSAALERARFGEILEIDDAIKRQIEVFEMPSHDIILYFANFWPGCQAVSILWRFLVIELPRVSPEKFAKRLETLPSGIKAIPKAVGSFLRTSAFPVANCVAEFVLVRALFQCQSTDDIRVCGTPFLGPDAGLHMVPVAPGDVCMLIDKDPNCELQRCVSLDRSALVASHTLTFTNTICTSPDPANSVAADRGYPKDLTYETVVRGVTQHEAGALARIPDDETRASWRGGAAGLVRQGPYTVFDCFSGAGGVTCGAKLAGFKVLQAVDRNSEAIETYKANHPGVGVLHMPVNEVIPSSSVLEGVLEGGFVDVLHCSPAHTRASERDQDNVDALFACCELVKRLRPRIVTVEQTFGLTRPGHSHILQTFLSDFTQHGYSIRYRVARLWVWGIPQKRKRLLIIASAPGEGLPTFPRDTHHPPRKGPRSRRGRKTRPWVTVGDAVRQISARGDDPVPA